MCPASISASRNPVARCTSGSTAVTKRVAAGVPRRPISRTRPSSSGRRAASRKTERTTASTRAHPVPAEASDASRAADSSMALRSMTASSRTSLTGEPVEDGLLADVEADGQGVERRRLVAPGGERGRGRRRGSAPTWSAPSASVRPPAGTGVAGSGRGPPASPVLWSTRVTYHMVDRSGDPRPRRPGRQAVLHHRRHRLPRDGPGRAHPAQRPRQPGGPPHPSRAGGPRPCSGPPRRSSRTTASTASARSSATGSTPPWPPGSRPWPATWPPTASASTTTAWRRLSRVRHRHPLGRRPSASTRPSTPPSRSTCSARPGWPPPSSTARRAGRGRRTHRTRSTSSRCPPPTWPAPTRARPRRSCSTPTRSPSTSTGATR